MKFFRRYTKHLLALFMALLLFIWLIEIPLSKMSGGGGRRRRRPDRMVVGHGDSPGCHSAAGVLLANLREGLAGLFVAEGVEQRHRPREGRLNPGFARDRKVNAPQRFARAVMRVLLLRARARYQSCAHADKCKSSSVSHWGSPRHLAPGARPTTCMPRHGIG